MIAGSLGLTMKHQAHLYSEWKGISCAGRFDYRLTELYTSMEMYTLARLFLGDEFYFFNDQMVYKLEGEQLEFRSHYDNQYGPNADNKIHTVNFSCILDDFESPLIINGEDVFPKRGDVIAIRGDTIHSSPVNTGKTRGLYACVYAQESIHMKDFYHERFTPNDIRKSYLHVTK